MTDLVAPAQLRQPSRRSWWPVLVANVVLGTVAYFIAFLFAYGFRAQVGLVEHVTFLVLIAVFAVGTGLIGMSVPVTREPLPPASRRAAFCVLVSLALNALAVGVGSIVSATHKEQNSVSVSFSTTTDVLVAAALFLAAVAFAVSARRVDLRPQRGPHN